MDKSKCPKCGQETFLVKSEPGSVMAGLVVDIKSVLACTVGPDGWGRTQYVYLPHRCGSEATQEELF